MKPIVLLFLLLGTPAFADETPVSQPLFGFASQHQVWLDSITSNGDDFLLIWKDDRSAMPVEPKSGGFGTIAAARISTDGIVLDQPNLWLPYYSPAPFTIGSRYIVPYGNASLAIDGARTFSLPLFGLHGTGAIASSGSSVMQVRFFNSIITTVGTTDLQTIRTSSLPHPTTLNGALAASRSGYAAVYGTPPNVDGLPRVMRLLVFDGGGNVINDSALIPENMDTFLAASDGDGYLVFGGKRGTLTGRLLTNGGAVLGEVNVSEVAYTPSVSWDGREYLLVYVTLLPENHVAIRALTITSGGLVSPPVTVDEVSRENLTSVVSASARGASAIAYCKAVKCGGLAFRSLAQLESGTANHFDIGQGAATQQVPAAATGAANSLVVWREHVNADDPFAVRGMRVDDDGHLLDATPLAIAPHTRDDSAVFTAAAGHEYLVVWGDDAGLRARRIADDGSALDAEPLTLDADADYPLAAPDAKVIAAGDAFLVVWRSRLSLRAAVVPLSGAATTSGDLSSFIPNSRPFAGFGGYAHDGIFTIIWCEVGPDPFVNAPIYARTLHTDGSIIAPRVLLGEGTADGVIWNGREAIVVSRDSALLVSPSLVSTPAPLRGFLPGGIRPIFDCTPARCGLLHIMADANKGTISSIAIHDDGGTVVIEPPLPLAVVTFNTAVDLSTFQPTAATFGRHGNLLAYQRIAPELGAVWRVYVTRVADAPRRRTAVR